MYRVIGVENTGINNQDMSNVNTANRADKKTADQKLKQKSHCSIMAIFSSL